MINRFLQYVKDEELFNSSHRILLAVSGGADSMVMLDLFCRAEFQVAVAHCNFHLRGEESDGDEMFIVDYCRENDIECFVKHFNTEEIANQEGVSIEMAARQLRYDWFNQILDEQGFDFLATAHHQDDVIETLFINLARGTGIKGLSGIKAKSGRLIRPMLFTSREEILFYASDNHIDFREDSSNSDTLYKRNLIRHQVLPLLEELNPAFRKNVLKTIENLKQTERLYQQKINELSLRLVEEDGDSFRILIEELHTCSPLNTVLFELLRPFGFQSEQMEDILNALDKESGKKFFSKEYRLVKDREYLIISPVNTTDEQLFYIENDCIEINSPLKMTFERLISNADYRFSTNPLIADFDYDKLIFPLILRKWREGEYFQPLGMQGFKKVSDFYIDEKLSIPEKENTWILASGDKVVWIVGRRIDNRFKVTGETNNILRINILY